MSTLSAAIENSGLHRIDVPLANGGTQPLGAFAGKVLLIVNTASHCGFTPQLAGLRSLQEKYAGRGFTVLAFPSNSFRQEFATAAQAREYCQLHFDANYPVMGLVQVRGPEAHALFRQLAAPRKQGGVGMAPRWNFFKYLVDKDGRVVDWFSSFTRPTSSRITRRIESLL